MGRFSSLLKTFRKNPELETDYLNFLGDILTRGHAELSQDPISPPFTLDEMPGILANREILPPINGWFVPHFGHYHPRKVRKLRVVFDSAAKFRQTSSFFLNLLYNK